MPQFKAWVPGVAALWQFIYWWWNAAFRQRWKMSHTRNHGVSHWSFRMAPEQRAGRLLCLTPSPIFTLILRIILFLLMTALPHYVHAASVTIIVAHSEPEKRVPSVLITNAVLPLILGVIVVLLLKISPLQTFTASLNSDPQVWYQSNGCRTYIHGLHFTDLALGIYYILNHKNPPDQVLTAPITMIASCAIQSPSWMFILTLTATLLLYTQWDYYISTLKNIATPKYPRRL